MLQATERNTTKRRRWPVDSGLPKTRTIQGNVQDATRAVETAYKAAATAFPTDEDMEPLQRPAKKKQLFQQEQASTKKVSLGVDGTGAGGSGASVTIGAGLPPRSEERRVGKEC